MGCGNSLPLSVVDEIREIEHMSYDNHHTNKINNSNTTQLYYNNSLQNKNN